MGKRPNSTSPESDSVLATLEILADRELTERLLALEKAVDDDVKGGGMLKTVDVFDE
jgi:hypothetical protein